MISDPWQHLLHAHLSSLFLSRRWPADPYAALQKDKPRQKGKMRMREAGRLPPRWAAIAGALMMIVCGCDAFSVGCGMGVKGSRASKQVWLQNASLPGKVNVPCLTASLTSQASCGGTLMQLREGGDEGNRQVSFLSTSRSVPPHARGNCRFCLWF
jgi:hypothetical protein